MTENLNHLRRLEEVWLPAPIYFITVCAADRAKHFAPADFHAIAREVWLNCERLYGWRVGRYVIMPDHVHFFCCDLREEHQLSLFVGKWKEWTAKYARARLSIAMPLWQAEFFDHVLRSSESYGEKWNYVRENPVRARLVTCAEEWEYQGELAELRFD
jgi:REP element-mobilizing transposase RayT